MRFCIGLRTRFGDVFTAPQILTLAAASARKNEIQNLFLITTAATIDVYMFVLQVRNLTSVTSVARALPLKAP